MQSTNSELLQNLIYHDGIKYGFAVFQFFKNGRWQHVMVDTRIPYNPQTKLPLYGRCDQLDEFWVPLMEKAYAKLHGTYEKLHGGSISESMVDLTGGVSEKFYLRAPEIVESIEGGQFWRDLKKFQKKSAELEETLQKTQDELLGLQKAEKLMGLDQKALVSKIEADVRAEIAEQQAGLELRQL